MFLEIEEEKKKKINMMINEYDFRIVTVIKFLLKEIKKLHEDGLSIPEICSILELEVNLKVNPGTLRRTLSRLNNQDKNRTKEEEKTDELEHIEDNIDFSMYPNLNLEGLPIIKK